MQSFASTPENFGHTANPMTRPFTSTPDPTIHPPLPSSCLTWLTTELLDYHVTVSLLTTPFHLTPRLWEKPGVHLARHTPCTQRLHQTARNQEQEKETSPGSIPHTTWKLKQILAKNSFILSTSTFPGTTTSTRFATNLASNSVTAACRTCMHHKKPQQ